MVDNSMNLNKMNNHLSPQLIEHKKKKDYDTSRRSSGVGNTGPDLGQAQKCEEVKLVNWIPTLPT